MGCEQLNGKGFGDLGKGAVKRQERASIAVGNDGNAYIRDGGLESNSRQSETGVSYLIPKSAGGFQKRKTSKTPFKEKIFGFIPAAR
jgi:hypothetical protein